MNWFDIADKSDVRAYELHQKMIEAMIFGDPTAGWVRVPRKLGFLSYCDGIHAEDISTWWNGFKHVQVMHYWTSDDKLYLRLPQSWEVPE